MPTTADNGQAPNGLQPGQSDVRLATSLKKDLSWMYIGPRPFGLRPARHPQRTRSNEEEEDVIYVTKETPTHPYCQINE